MITVKCPHCQRSIVGSDKFAGQYRECPNCRELFVALPSNDDSSADLSNESSADGEIRLPPAGSDHKSHLVTAAREEDSEPTPDNAVNLVEKEVAIPPICEVSVADPLPEISLPTAGTDLDESRLMAVWTKALKSKESRSYLISTAVHAVILLILAAWILPQLPETDLPGLITVLPESRLDDSLDTIAFDAAPQPDQKESIPEPIVSVAVSMMSHSNLYDASKVAILPSSNAKPNEPGNPKVDSSKGGTRSEPGPEPREATVSQATSVEGATDAIIESIKSKLLERDTAVIWLMDRSGSMQRQRSMLADRLEGYLKEVHESRTDDSHSLMHIVVAFGDRFDKIAITNEPGKALIAIRKDYGLDPTGNENVFSAIQWCEDQFVKKNAQNRSKNLMCVVCTDESGDDYLQLERTIQKCRSSRLEVSVIGPSAVLGQMQGYHAYTAKDNLTYYLPVVRGPDTALPQRIMLPYWFRNVPAHWDESKRGPWYGGTPVWQGGSNLDAMLSGFGPYALTRLTMATGGDFILYDRPGDGSPFEIDTLRPYLPDYRAANVIQSDLYEKPLRMAILQAVEMSRQSKLAAPRFDYGVQFGGSFYYTPQEFQAGLRNQLVPEKQRAESALQLIDQMIALFENR
ncbi:MAG: VWA domain-containing protein, partial [Planctomycetota bacterium]|nr:VWA domain-containing protein [Planctomycetota bacterium]